MNFPPAFRFKTDIFSLTFNLNSYKQLEIVVEREILRERKKCVGAIKGDAI